MKNIYSFSPWDKTQEQFTSLFKGKSVRIERIVSSGHTTNPNEWYDQEEFEFVMLVQGKARLEFADGEEMWLSAGDYCCIEPHQKHRVTYTSIEPICIWIAVFINPIE